MLALLLVGHYNVNNNKNCGIYNYSTYDSPKFKQSIRFCFGLNVTKLNTVCVCKNWGGALLTRVVADFKGQHLNKEIMVDSMKVSHCQSENSFFFYKKKCISVIKQGDKSYLKAT